MTAPETSQRSWPSWIVLAPLLMLAGIGLGHLWTGAGSDRPYREPPAEPPHPRVGNEQPRETTAAMPSFAPIAARVLPAVVGIKTIVDSAPVSETSRDDSPANGILTGSGF